MNGESDRFRQAVYGIAAAATLAYGGWLGVKVSTISDNMTERLARIETTMAENRGERQIQLDEIRRRIDRLEARAYREDRNDR
jgi:hypothetical protein